MDVDGYHTKYWYQVHQTPLDDKKNDIEVERIARRLRVEPPASILDIPSGPGRHALRLAELGFEVTAVDLSERALADGRQHHNGQRVIWKHADMRDITFNAAFDAVLCYWGSFGYFGHLENRQVLQSFRSALRPGGALLLNGHTTESYTLRYGDGVPTTKTVERGGLQVREHRVFDVASGTGRLNAEYFDDGACVEVSTQETKFYTQSQYETMLDEVGFHTVEWFDGREDRPLEPHSRYVTLVAR